MFASVVDLVGGAVVAAVDGDVVGFFARADEVGSHAAHKDGCVGELKLLDEFVEAVLF